MKALLLFALLLASVSASIPAKAQAPPHKPGQICFSPAVNWCWNQTAVKGEIGKVCYCPVHPNGTAIGRFTSTESESDYQSRLKALGLNIPSETDGASNSSSQSATSSSSATPARTSN